MASVDNTNRRENHEDLTCSIFSYNYCYPDAWWLRTPLQDPGTACRLLYGENSKKKLDLNDEQKVKLDAIKDEMLAVREEMKGKREETRNTVNDLLSAPVFDQDMAVALVNGRVEDISAQSPRIIAALAGFWDSLNPEQQAKIREKLEKHFDHNGCWSHGRFHYL